MKCSILSLVAVALAVLVTAAAQAQVERNGQGARVGIASGSTTRNTQSWTVYAPSGRPVIWRPRPSDNRWWPSN
jgi:hypothetical protein